MIRDFIKKCVLPPGPILSLTLIGLLLLGAILYYKAVKIQRFLEPALALSQPRIKFNQSINDMLSKEFGASEARGVKFSAGSILVDESMCAESAHFTKGAAPEVLGRLGRVFLSALDAPDTKEHISLIIVNVRFPLGTDPVLNRMVSLNAQQRAWLLLDSLYAATPQLEQKYGTYFTAAALPAGGTVKRNSCAEFRLVPTEQLHIEVLQKLEKYME